MNTVHQPGFGAGSYSVPATFTMTVPKTGTVLDMQTLTSSKYKVGDSVGLPSTSYTATVTYTLGSGI